MEHHLVVGIPRGFARPVRGDLDTGEVWLDRSLFTGMQYPADDGDLVEALAEDRDPLDTVAAARTIAEAQARYAVQR